MRRRLAIACFCLASAVLAAGHGAASDIRAQIEAAIARAGQGGVPMISPVRGFPVCVDPVAVSAADAAWSAVEVSCAAPPWRRTVRLGPALPGRDLQVGTVKASDAAPRLVLRQSLARGSIIRPVDLVVSPHGARRVSGAIVDPADAVGRRLRANLGAGQILLARHLDPAWGIEAGAPVTLLMDMGSVVIETAGIAETSAQVGEIVGVRNARSGRRVFGQVIERNKIRIRPNMRAADAVLPCSDTSQRCRKD
ncbi:MAG: flagellar basal body P-ring formation chaperone FlgA [Pseudomonadota bacterium]